MAPQLPPLCTLDESFDAMSLQDQGAAVLVCTAGNETRRRAAEAILERCSRWISDQLQDR